MRIKTLMVLLLWITFSNLYVLGQCPLTQDVTPAPTSIPLSLVLSETANRYQLFAAEVHTLVIRQRTQVIATQTTITETLWVSGNRYRLERTQQRDNGPSTLAYIFDGTHRWVSTPSGQNTGTSVLETPQPYVDWSLWFNDQYNLDGLGEYMNHPVFMLRHPEPAADAFSEIWIDAERLLPLVVRQDTVLGRTVTVFADYQLLEGTQSGWIPWTRELYREGQLLEQTQVLNVLVNEPLNEDLFRIER